MSGEPAPKTLWGGRFREDNAPEMVRLNRSLSIDHRLWRDDIAGSMAWAGALRGVGVLSEAEETSIRGGLEAVSVQLAAWGPGDWAGAADEDIHTLIERLLGDAIGPLAGKLATGRSRNDQVATAARLWALRAAEALDGQIRDLQAALLEQAEAHVDTVMPAYTHLQRAQPVSGAHWLLSHVWPLYRDRDRLAGAMVRTGSMPLGSGAVTGSPYPVDRQALRDALWFDEVAPNSMDAVGDRDFVAELLFVMALTGTHLSRLGEDVVLFASSEFGFLRLPDSYSTGSSLMPQKRNPDVMELARGKAGRLVGELAGWLVTLKGLPTGYSKDLQEDKAALFAAFDTLAAMLPAVAGAVGGMTFDPRACAAAIDPGMLATDLADALVGEGVPFRQAHEHVGRLVRAAEDLGCALGDVPPAVAREISSAFAAIDMGQVLDPRRSLERRTAEGGTAPDAVRNQLAAAWARLDA